MLVDSVVMAVEVDGLRTVATMAAAPTSACLSTQYIYPRREPLWLRQTGRLMQAVKERAVVRISFTCQRGSQTINAIQFLPTPS